MHTYRYTYIYIHMHMHQAGRGPGVEFSLGRFPWAPGRVSYHPGPISGSVFLWRCFCRRKPPCSRKCDCCGRFPGVFLG